MKRVALLVALLLSLSACLESRETFPTPSGTATQTTDLGATLRSLVAADAPRWRALAEAPEARQEVGAAFIDGRVYVAGGLTASGATARVDIYDIEQNTWTEAPDLPRPLHHLMMATYRNQVYVIGGFDAASQPQTRVYSISAGGRAWTQRASLNRPRAAGAAVVVGAGDSARLFVVGGQAAGELAAPAEELDRRTGRWVDRAPIPTPRHHVAAVANETTIFVTGGRRPAGGGGPDSNVAAFDRYFVAEDRWEKLPNVPTARSGHGAGLVNGRVVVFGGEDPAASGQPSIAVTEEYNTGRNVWGRTYPAMFRARHGVGAVTVGDDIYVFLGGSRSALAPTADSDVLITP